MNHKITLFLLAISALVPLSLRAQSGTSSLISYDLTWDYDQSGNGSLPAGYLGVQTDNGNGYKYAIGEGKLKFKLNELSLTDPTLASIATITKIEVNIYNEWNGKYIETSSRTLSGENMKAEQIFNISATDIASSNSDHRYAELYPRVRIYYTTKFSPSETPTEWQDIDKHIIIYFDPKFGSAETFACNEGETINKTFNCPSPEGGNPSGWVFDKTFRVGNAPTISGDEYQISDTPFTRTYINRIPNGTEIFRKEDVTVGTLRIYNKPPKPQSLVGYVLDPKTNETIYMLINMGLTDSQISSNTKLNFLFDNNSSSNRYYTSTIDIKTAEVFYDYDGHKAGYSLNIGNNKYSPAVSGAMTMPSKKFGNFTHNPILNSGTWNAWLGSEYDFSGIRMTINGANASKSNITVGTSTYSYSDKLASPSTGSNIDIKLHWKYNVKVENNQNYEYAYEAIVAQANITKAPAMPAVSQSFKNTDIAENSPIDQLSATNPDVWRYQWVVNGQDITNATTNAYTPAPIEIAGDEFKFEAYNYTLKATYIAPDGKSEWASGTLDFGSVTIYNKPKTPDAVRCYMVGNQNRTVMFGVNSDKNTKYSFIDKNGNQIAGVKDNRYVETTDVIRVETFYEYPKLTVYSNSITPSETFKAEMASSFAFTDTEAQAVKTDDGKWHCLVGDKIRVTASANEDNDLSISLKGIDAKLGNASRELRNSNNELATELDVANRGAMNLTLNYNYTITPDAGVTIPVTYTHQMGEIGTAYQAPISPKITDKTYQRADNEDLIFAPEGLGAATGGNEGGWSYEWLRSIDEGTETQVSTSLDYTDGSSKNITGTNPEMHTYAYRLRAKLTAPDGKTPWFDEIYNAGTLKVYNAPANITKLVQYNTPTNTQYAVHNLGTTDALIESDGVSHNRIWVANSAPRNLKAFFPYSDGFKAYSEAYSGTPEVVDGTSEISIIGSTGISGLPDYKYVEHDGKYHALVGDGLHISRYAKLGSESKTNIGILNVNGMETAEGGDFTYTPANDGAIKAFASTDFTISLESGIPEFTGTISVQSKTIDLAVIYPTPVVPAENTGFKSQNINEGTKLDALSVNKASGSTNNWEYAWVIDGNIIDGATQTAYTPVAPVFDELEMKAESHSYALNYKNIAPDGSIWVQGTVPFGTLNTYNLPKTPGKVLRYKVGNEEYTILADLDMTNDQIVNTHADYKFIGTDKVVKDNRYVETTEVSYVESYYHYTKSAGYPDDYDAKAADVPVSEIYYPTENQNVSIIAKDGHDAVTTTDDSGSAHWYGWLEDQMTVTYETPTLHRATPSTPEVSYFNNVGQLPDGTMKTAGDYRAGITYKYAISPEENLDVVVNATNGYDLGWFATAYNIPEMVTPVPFAKQSSDISNDLAISLSAAPGNGGNSDGWSYQWMRECEGNTATIAATVTTESVSGVDSDTEGKSIEGIGKKTRSYTYGLHASLTAPDGKTKWFDQLYFAGTLKVYNTPPTVQNITKYELSNDDIWYAIHDLGTSNDQFADIELLVDNIQQPERVWKASNNPLQISTRYYYDDFTVLNTSLDFKTNEVKAERSFEISRMSTIPGNNDYLAYINENGVWEAVAGTSAMFDAAPKLGNAELTSVALYVNDAVAEVSEDGSYKIPEDYTKSTSGENLWAYGKYTFKVNLENNGSVTHDFTFSDPSKVLAKIYPPIKNASFYEANKLSLRYQDDNIKNVELSVNTASGGNGNWSYNWLRNGKSLYSNNTSNFTDKNLPGIDGFSYGKEDYEYDVVITLTAPNNKTIWSRQTIELGKATIYNTPKTPAKFENLNFNGVNHYSVLNLSEDNLTNYLYVFTNSDGSVSKEISERTLTDEVKYNRVNTRFIYDDFVAESPKVQLTSSGGGNDSFTLDWSDPTIFGFSTAIKIYEPYNAPIKEEAKISCEYSGPITTVDGSGNITDHYGIAYFDMVSFTLNTNATNKGYYRIQPYIAKKYEEAGKSDETINGLNYQPTKAEVFRAVPGVKITCDLDGTGNYSDIAEYTAEKDDYPLIHIYDEAVVPEMNATPTRLKFDDDEEISLDYGFKEASGANPNAWSYNWINGSIDLPSGENMIITGTFTDDSKEPNIVTYEPVMTFSNKAPVGDGNWISGTIEVDPFFVYNTPEQPESLGHFISTDGKHDKWFAMNMGMTDNDIDENSYTFLFSNGSTINGGRVLEPQQATDINSIIALWKYDDGYVSPREDRQAGKLVKKINEYSLSFTPTIEIKPNENRVDKDNYQADYVTTEENGVDIYHTFANNTVIYTPQLTGNGIKVNSHSYSLNEVQTTPGNDGKTSWNPSKEGEYKYTHTVEGEIPAETGSVNQTVGISDSYSETKLYVYAEPKAAPNTIESRKLTDIQSFSDKINMNSYSGGNIDANGQANWSYNWTRVITDGNNITTEENWREGCVLDLSADDFSDACEYKNKKTYSYSLVSENMAPDGETIWYKSTRDGLNLTVYNAPNAPTALYYYSDDNNSANNHYIAGGLGLSDAQISERDYILQFIGDNGSEESHGFRTLKETDSFKASKVRSIWKYDDQYVAPSAVAELSENKFSANANIVNMGIGGVEDQFYKNAVRAKGNHWYAYAGSVNTISIGQTNCTLNHILAKSDKNDEISGYKDQNGYYKFNLSKPGLWKIYLDGESVVDVDSYIENGVEKSVTATMNVYAESNYDITIYDAPTAYPCEPTESKTTNAVRDVDDDILLHYLYGNNANPDGWNYEWEIKRIDNNPHELDVVIDEETTDAHSTVKSIDINQIVANNLDEDVMGTISLVCRLNWWNETPEGQRIVEGSIDYPVNIYNTPKTPSGFVPKGNGNSGIYIVTDLGLDNGQDLNEYLKEHNYYQFQFVSDNSDWATAPDGKRWFKLGSGVQNPMARTLWEYPDGYQCFSNAVGLLQNGDSRSDISLTDLYSADGEEIEIFTISGLRIDLGNTTRLVPGVYVVVHGSDDAKWTEKIAVR